MKKPLKLSKRAISRGMTLPGMESHIRRLEGSWRIRYPSDEILDRWIRCRVGDMILSEMLRIKTTSELLKIYNELITKG
jgi:hypothetical protein